MTAILRASALRSRKFTSLRGQKRDSGSTPPPGLKLPPRRGPAIDLEKVRSRVEAKKAAVGSEEEGGREFKKGAFDLSRGGLPALEAKAQKEMVGSIEEAIDFSKHEQPVFSKFRGANETDWEMLMDMLLDRDSYNRNFLRDWEKREPGKMRAFACIHVLPILMSDIYLANPHRRETAAPAVITASSRLEEKTLKAGWWQEAFRKLLFKGQVEEVPYLRCIAEAVTGKKLNRFHTRNLVNTYAKNCTRRVPLTTTEMVKDLDLIWGSYFYMIMEVLEVEMQPEFIEACSHMGKAYGLINVIRSLQEAPITHCVLAPQDMMKSTNCSLDDFISKKNTRGTAELIYRLLELMLQEANLATEKAKYLAIHYKTLLFFRYMCEIRACMTHWHKFGYKLPTTELDVRAHSVYWEKYRREAVIIKTLRLHLM
ncbi:hypothetical protein DIPPA_04638 [Diplonema papillatum]|nr:hypothetical protein DIPPA_04638 [Diplonema papillatum]